MTVTIVVADGSLRVEFADSGGQYTGKYAADWIRDFTSGVGGDPAIAEGLKVLQSAGGCGCPHVVSGQGVGSQGDVGELGLASGCGRSEAAVEHTRGGPLFEEVGTSGDHTSFGTPRLDSRPIVIVRGQEKGPNYIRNQANRMKKRVEKQVRVEQRANRFPEKTEQEKKLHELRVKRQIVQEERKLKRLESPSQIISDAMYQVSLAEKYAKLANDSKVAAWAADLSSASAESVARLAGYESSGGGKESSVTRLSGSDLRVESSVDKGFGELGDKNVNFLKGRDENEEKKKKTGVTNSVYNPVTRSDGSVSVAKVFSGGGTSFTSSVADLPRPVFEQVVNDVRLGVDSSSGKSIDSGGVSYNAQTAAAWLRRYSKLRKHVLAGKSDEQIAKDACVSLLEVKKYLRLRSEFYPM